MFLVIVDTTQIQPYVFGSNRLRENVGASFLVSQATTVWALAAVDEVTKSNNILEVDKCELDTDVHIENDNLKAEVIYVGGGNAVVIFKESGEEIGDTDKFIRNLSLKVLTNAPGLQLVIVKKSFDWANDSLVQTVDQAFKQLEEMKRRGNQSVPLLGLSVSAMCQSTGLPAVEHVRPVNKPDSDSYDASPEIVAKLRAVKRANARLIAMFGGNPKRTFQGNDAEFAFPLDFDNLGRSKGEHSFIAVAHADGDGMGKRIQSIGKKHQDRDNNGNYAAANRGYVNDMRRFSTGVEEAGREALSTTLNVLVNHIEKDGTGYLLKHPQHSETVAPVKFAPNDNKGEIAGDYFLPFRPLVFGGDDVTFVCDGRLGLSLAMLFMREFAEETGARLNDFGGAVTASAGVTIVKSHYPFARAYELVEGLSHSAKSYKRKIGNDYSGACLDWHIALSGLAGSIAEIRRREYMPRRNSLTQLPVTLEENPHKSLRSWTRPEKALGEFQSEKWSNRRNKLKDLREALRFGKDAVEGFLTAYGLKEIGLPDIGEGADIRETGWDSWSDTGGGTCGYFDAIELTDWFIPLEGEQG